MKKVACKSPDLLKFLRNAETEDLTVLIDYLTDNGNGRISLSSESKDALLRAKDSAQNAVYAARDVELIVTELERFGGNSLVNLFRGGAGVSYEEIVRDVRDHVGAKSEPNETVASMEVQILSKILEGAWSQMTAEQKKEIRAAVGLSGKGSMTLAAVIAAMRLGGFGTYRMTLLIANMLARQLTGHGLKLATNAGIARVLGVVAGPIGWIATGLWTAFDLASPAYRVTLPCVVQIAYMRQRQMNVVCPKCYAPNESGAKACAECGARLTRRA